jgi:hypothetical protein
MRLSGLAILATFASLLCFSTTAWGGGPWSLFGNASLVKDGQKPNFWAVALSSRCSETSFNCLEDGALVYSGVTFKAPNRKLTFRSIYQLSASYKITEWDCGGGSPRFVIGIDTDGDRKVNSHIFVYIGPPPGFTGCDMGVWRNISNLIDGNDSEARFDIGQFMPQMPYLTYRDVLAALGDLSDRPVLYVMLVVDGGWLADQVVLVDDVRVNNFKLSAKGFAKN